MPYEDGGFKPDDKVVKWRDCPDCNGRGWFLIRPFATGGGNGVGGISNMRQCPRCVSEYETQHAAIAAANWKRGPRMNLRCTKFWLRGTLSLRPIPDHRDLRCWMSGQSFTGWCILAAIPIVLVAGGFVAGRNL